MFLDPKGWQREVAQNMLDGKLRDTVTQYNTFCVGNVSFLLLLPELQQYLILTIYAVLTSRHMAMVEVARRRYLGTSSFLLEKQCCPCFSKCSLPPPPFSSQYHLAFLLCQAVIFLPCHFLLVRILKQKNLKVYFFLLRLWYNCFYFSSLNESVGDEGEGEGK